MGSQAEGKGDADFPLVSVAEGPVVILSEAKDLEKHGDSSFRSE
jgi:hypothetical protein